MSLTLLLIRFRKSFIIKRALPVAAAEPFGARSLVNGDASGPYPATNRIVGLDSPRSP